MQRLVFSCASLGLILARWNALKPFSATARASPLAGRVPPPPQEWVLYKMAQELARLSGFILFAICASKVHQ